MFETIIKTAGSSRRRWLNMALSASIQALVLGAVVVSTLYATGALPDPPDMMAFVVVASPPPPPPPPPSPAVAKRAPNEAVSPTTPQPIAAQPMVAAPVEAPAEITAETGREADVFARVKPGFESDSTGGVVGGVVGGIDTALPAPPPAPVRIGGAVAAPRLIRRVEPDYPALAQSAQIEGLVILEAKVDAGGNVDAVTVLRSNSALDKAAIDALKQWKYEPLMWHGRPTPFVLTVTLSFSLKR